MLKLCPSLQNSYIMYVEAKWNKRINAQISQDFDFLKIHLNPNKDNFHKYTILILFYGIHLLYWILNKLKYLPLY